MHQIVVFSPAKINLFLAILGRRPDGFHSLFSLVAPVDFGDYIYFTFEGETDVLVCQNTGIPTDDTNLILRALKLFREKYPCPAVRITLEKNIPMGAGLGGGSSNGTAFLKALNAFFGFPLSHDTLCSLAARLGSDCTLFCYNEPTFMSGRGEVVSPANIEVQERLKNRRLLIFKPSFGISTPWAYQTLAQNRTYVSPGLVSELKAQLLKGDLPYVNSMESVIFGRYPFLKELQTKLFKEFNFYARLSGSGSSFFGFLDNSHKLQEIRNCLSGSLGKDTFIVETFIK